MTEKRPTTDSLRRPKLLVRAARAGLTDYRRERDLPRLLGGARTPSPLQAVNQLMERERALEEARQTGGADYSFMRHIDYLIALIAELRVFPRAV